jgi:4,5-dihydroxyphthalate decarboxylase
MRALRLIYRGPRHLDRTVPLETGEVRAPGIELEVEATASIGGCIEAVRDGRADAAEVLFSDFFAGAAAGDDSIVGLPIFLVRRFAHRYIYVSAASDLDAIAALDRRRLGWPGGGATAAVWALALAEQAAAKPELVSGPMGGALAKMLDGGEQGERLVDRVRRGDLDGLISPYPVSHQEGGEALRLLLRDPGAHEREHVRRGGYFPPNSLVVLRREVYEADRWVAANLVDAFAEAQALGAQRLNYYGALAVALPWLSSMTEEVDALFGGSPYPYGLAANQRALADFARHAAALGIAAPEVAPEALFPPEVRDHPGVPDTTAYGVPMEGVRAFSSPESAGAAGSG